MIRHLIWDVDGTLFDTYPALARALHAALADLGKEAAPPWIRDLAQVSLRHCIATLAHEFDVSQEDLERGFLNHYGRIPVTEQPPFPGVVDVCKSILAAGGSNYIVTHRKRESTLAFLDAHAMAPYFADLLAGDDGYPRKPDPAIFEAMIERHGLERAKTLAIGDREIDSLGGRAAGLRTCLFGARESQTTADLSIGDYADLLCFLSAENDKDGGQG